MARHLAIAFAVALALYAAGFSWIEHRRVVKGPWEVVFAADAAGQPSLSIAQPTFHISEKLFFPGGNAGRTNFSQEVRFTELHTNLPFGEFLFQDALYLPGDLTMRVCGHQIEMLPRTLIVDRVERPWHPGGELVLPVRP